MLIFAYCGNEPTEPMAKVMDYYRSYRHTVLERNPDYFDSAQLPAVKTDIGLVILDNTFASTTDIKAYFDSESVTTKVVSTGYADELVGAEDPEYVVDPIPGP